MNGEKIAFHRHVVELQIGRKLTSNEVVHHVDGNPLNNDPANLVVLTRAEHQRMHAEGERRKWTLEEKARAAELRASGMTIQQAARALSRCAEHEGASSRSHTLGRQRSTCRYRGITWRQLKSLVFLTVASNRSRPADRRWTAIL